LRAQKLEGKKEEKRKEKRDFMTGSKKNSKMKMRKKEVLAEAF